MSTEEHLFFSFFQIDVWQTGLNRVLPSPLYQIETWLQEVEKLIDEDLSVSQDYNEAMALTQGKITLFQVGKEKRNREKNLYFVRTVLEEDFSPRRKGRKYSGYLRMV